jgi:hypothetical protein
MIGPNPLFQIDVTEQTAVASVDTTHRRLRYAHHQRITTTQTPQRISAAC